MNNTVLDDQRSKSFVLIPFCLICQAFQAKGIVRYGFKASIKPIIDILLNEEINLIQMPCPESMLGGYAEGLNRSPKGYFQYQESDFLAICKAKACETYEMIKGILCNGYRIIAILGIEYSPSCSTDLQYTNKGTMHKPGHFIVELKALLNRNGIEIPFVGINRKAVAKSERTLRELISSRLK